MSRERAPAVARDQIEDRRDRRREAADDEIAVEEHRRDLRAVEHVAQIRVGTIDLVDLGAELRIDRVQLFIDRLQLLLRGLQLLVGRLQLLVDRLQLFVARISAPRPRSRIPRSSTGAARASRAAPVPAGDVASSPSEGDAARLFDGPDRRTEIGEHAPGTADRLFWPNGSTVRLISWTDPRARRDRSRTTAGRVLDGFAQRGAQIERSPCAPSRAAAGWAARSRPRDTFRCAPNSRGCRPRD